MKKTIIIAVLLLGIATGAYAQVFVGVNVGAGLETTTNNTAGLTYGVGADVAFLNTSFGTWGLFANSNGSIGTAGHTDLGVIHLPRDWKERTAFIWGAGVDIRSATEKTWGRSFNDDNTEIIGPRDEKGFGVVLRAGVAFKWHLYLTGSIAIGGYTADEDTYSLSHTPVGLHYNGFQTEKKDNAYVTIGLNLGYRF